MEDGLFSSPNLFAYTLPNCMLGEVAINGKFTGGNFVVSQETPDMLAGIHAAVEMIGCGLFEQVLAGYCNTAGTQAMPGAVFIAIKKSEGETSLSYDGNSLMYNHMKISGIEELINRIAELSNTAQEKKIIGYKKHGL